MSCTELFVSELWKEGKLEPYKLFLKENVLFQERIQCIRVECKKSTEFRLPNYCAPKENLKYYLENRLSMKFMYLQIPTLYLVSSDILPHTQNFSPRNCLKHVSYERFVDHALKEVPRFNIKILSVKRLSGRPAVLCC